MPEYLAPGVFVEETSFRAKSIEGVATSTTGFVGPCRAGPTQGAHLVTSFEEFKRRFGGSEDLRFGVPYVNYVNHLAHAARVFFENGGKRLYVARVHEGATAAACPVGLGAATFCARGVGASGNLTVKVARVVSGNTGASVLRGGDIASLAGELGWIEIDAEGVVTWHGASGTQTLTNDEVRPIQRHTLRIEVGSGAGREVYDNLSTHPDALQTIWRALDPQAPTNPNARVGLDLSGLSGADAVALMNALSDPKPEVKFRPFSLTGGTDGELPGSAAHAGAGEGKAATGLLALASVDDIAIVAAPAASGLSETEAQAVRDSLITHCETQRYRVAILSAPKGTPIEEVRRLRGKHDSTHAALYHPWVTVRDPNSRSGAPITLPPDGFIAGIYARTDVERGVHKAPANEVVRGALDLEDDINQGQQEVLNPEGINCLRFFGGRGYRVWGGRTISSDPEWKYINVRRLFNYLEHSIDKATQWAVFEPNNEQLWLKIRLTVESFLTDVWRTGALMGSQPKDAFFVRCDHTTMTQGDLDNGRLICLVGVAPTKPAEFVIFRVGQWTSDASTL